jgi:predicted  nucleic acid-binding Zn-ribbon protein
MKEKSAWNKAHEAKREDERARALSELHDYITKLESSETKARLEAEALRQKMKAIQENLVDAIDDIYGVQPTFDSIEDAIASLLKMIRKDHVHWRETLLERDALKKFIEGNCK